MSETKKIAVVTGATGYAAGHIIKGLVQRGYHVRGTVRSKGKAEQLTKLFPEVCQLGIILQSSALKQSSHRFSVFFVLVGVV